MQGWKMVAKELQETLREITMLGFGLILICHSKEKASNYTDEDGNPISSVEPDLSKNVYTVVNAICDLIAYINVEFDIITDIVDGAETEIKITNIELI